MKMAIKIALLQPISINVRSFLGLFDSVGQFRRKIIFATPFIVCCLSAFGIRIGNEEFT
jgi:hypothetical protein